MSNKKVGIVGSGLVGKSWAMIFASQGYQVSKTKWLVFVLLDGLLFSVSGGGL